MIPLTISNLALVVGVAVVLFVLEPAARALRASSRCRSSTSWPSGSPHASTPRCWPCRPSRPSWPPWSRRRVAGVRVVKGFGAEPVQLASSAARPRTSAPPRCGRRGHPPALPAGDRPPAVARAHRRAGHRRPPGARGTMTIGGLVAFNAYVALLVWPLRTIGMTVAFGAARRGGARAGQRGALDRADRRRPAPSHGAAGPRRRPARRARSASTTSASATTRRPGARRLRPHDRARVRRSRSSAPRGRASRPSPVCSPASTTSSRAPSSSTASTCGGSALHDLRRAVGIVFEDTFLFHDTVAANIAFADPDASFERIERAAALAGAAEFVDELPGWLRHAARRARLLALRGPAPAHRHRPGDPRRPPRARARRRHLGRRPLEGARDPRRPGDRDGRPHHDRHRPPSGHDRARRPGGAARRGQVAAVGTHDELLGDERRYREVLAAWAASEAERDAAVVDGDGDDGADVEARGDGERPRTSGRWPDHVGMRRRREEDQLDRAATKRVLRRTVTLARPVRRDLVASLVLVAGSTLVHAGRPDARALRHRPRADAADDTQAVERRRRPVRGRRDRGVLHRACPAGHDQPGRRGLPPRPAGHHVRPPAAPVDGVLRPREGGGARVPHDVRHRLDGRAGPVRAAAVRLGRRCCSCSRSCCCS